MPLVARKLNGLTLPFPFVFYLGVMALCSSKRRKSLMALLPSDIVLTFLVILFNRLQNEGGSQVVRMLLDISANWKLTDVGELVILSWCTSFVKFNSWGIATCPLKLKNVAITLSHDMSCHAFFWAVSRDKPLFIA